MMKKTETITWPPFLLFTVRLFFFEMLNLVSECSCLSF